MTVNSPLHSIVSRLGELEGTLRTFMQQWRDQDNAAQLGRRVVHEKMELLTMQVNRVSIDLQNLQQDMAELKNDIETNVMPIVNAIKIEQARKFGAKSVWVLIGSGVMAVASMLAYLGDKITHYLIPRP